MGRWTNYWSKPWNCKKCGSDQFWISVRKSGKRVGQKERRCKECERVNCTAYRKKRGNEWWNSVIRANKRRYTFLTLQKYGGKCECCGESNPAFLQIDHINGGGTKEREECGGQFAHNLYRLPVRADLRVLCANCNFAKGRKNFCPHESLRHLAGEVS